VDFNTCPVNVFDPNQEFPMVSILRIITSLIPNLLLGFLLCAPLHAQLDPRLQGSSTDFLDLYQQGNVNVKPEIATIFDFSGSMQSLMYHPCYYNHYLDDNGDTTGISFQLTGLPGSFVVTATVGPSTWGYTSTKLIRPDGSLVTEANIDNATTGMKSVTPHLWGDINDTHAGSWGCDVRNWVRSASHIRITKNGRTIDLPIPWKVMDRNSTGYPLTSMTVKDQYIGLNDQGVTTTYGTGQDIEIDTRYKIQTFPSGTDQQTIDNNMVLSGAQDQVVTRTKYMLRLNQFYLDWLFTGKYQNSDSKLPDYNPTLNGQYIVFDAASLTPNGTSVGLQTRLEQGQGFGTFQAGEDSLKALALPGRDRVQAVKEAAIRTWIAYQTRVFWAFRFLDDVGEAGNDGHQNATASTINNNSTTIKNTTDATTTWVNGKDTGWTLFNANSVAAMTRLAALFPYTNTPLCYATARALAQFTDPNNIFGTVETGTDAPVSCQKHFLIVFTDGVPTVDRNSQNLSDTPYISDASLGTGDAQTGNTALISNKTNIDPGNAWWNIFTYAGAAAHLSDTSKTTYTKDLPITTTMVPPTAYPTGSSAPSAFLPFAVKRRLSVDISAPYRQVTTMTVGVSLGGLLTDANSPKRRLFLAAAVGDPKRTSWNLSVLTNYTPVDANNPSLGKTPNSTYFFDATNPDLLTKSLGYAFSEATGGGGTGVTSNPNLPFIGASVGKQIYIGKFKPPVGGDVLWSGDLLMFPTKIDAASKTVILDKTGAPTTTLDGTTAVWSAAANMPLWSARTLKTRIPGASTLTDFTYTGAAYTNSTTGLQNFVAAANITGYPVGGAAQQNLIKMIMGAEPWDNTKNRADIMGDIIDSNPSYLEYDRLSLPTSVAVPTGSRFRIILVGTNQGWLHAFGETSTISSVDDPSSTTTPKAKVDLVSATVKELWAFMPTDFLNNLDYLNVSSNSHKFMVDGSPSIYFLDLPPSTGGIGNGRLDGANIAITPATDTTHERAIAIIGLRKGGRSYYALNLHDPTQPTLQWSLVPDEASQITNSRNKTGLSLAALQGIVANMGYSTCSPSFGRILFNGVYKDAVFLGGGLGLPEIEAKFTGKPLMGRSVLALDVNTGDILTAVDLTSNAIGGQTITGTKTMIGPISAGVVPFEFSLGSGMAQRAYFLDLWGGLWCWGSKNTVATSPFSSYANFRRDTSELTAWSSDGTSQSPYANTGVRKVYQDAASIVTASGTTPTTYSFTGPKYTTLPAPFLLRTFPGKGVAYADGTTAVPAAVGIAMVSGDRNNPADYGTNNPANTRLTLVFDRQDSRAWGLDTALGPDQGINSDTLLLSAGKWKANGIIDSTLASGAASISPGNASYYLAPNTSSSTKFGYYVTFPDASNSHYSKGITQPSVVANTLYYSYFTPDAVDVCTGATGYTYTNKICDVMNPIVSDVRTSVVCRSGNVDTWFNVASEFSVLGTPGVQQAGTRSVDDKDNTGSKTTVMDTNTYLGETKTFFPKARVWRTVH
jgi:hypothetical protein